MRCSIDDIKRVARVLMDDSVLPFTFDDSVSCKNDIVLSHFVNNRNLYFLMPNDDCVAIVIPMNYITYDFHFNALPKIRRISTITSCQKAIEYMFDKTQCRKLVAHVPACFDATVRFYGKLGWELEGQSKKSFLKNDILHNQILFGLTKEDYKCLGYQQQ